MPPRAAIAAVVGVIFNLLLWFALQTLFAQREVVVLFGARVDVPVLSSVNVMAVLVALLAFVGLWRRWWGIVPVVLGSAAVGLFLHAFR